MRPLLAIVTLAVALAGCTDDVASGNLVSAGNGLVLDGTVDLTFTEKVRNADGTPLEDQLCPPAGSPPSQFDCQDPSVAVEAHIMAASDPGTDGYTLYFVNATEEFMIGALMAEEGMYNFNGSFDGDYTGYTSVELRIGEVVVGSAPSQQGTNTFALNEDLGAVSVDGSWEGKTLTVGVTGLNATTSYTGWLVSVDEAGEKVHDVSFSIVEGENTYTASGDIEEWSEFHIHVTGTKVNVAILTIE